MTDRATFVLVHGAWHGAWCWDEIVPVLEAAGHGVEAVEMPFTSPDDDVAEVTATLDRTEGRKVLVGHSYGGQVISEAASGRSDVARLVYVCAFAPDREETLVSLMASAPDTPLAGANKLEGDALVVEPDRVVEAFYAMSPPALAKSAIARLRPFRVLPPLSERRVPAWKSIPSTYVVCSEDQAIHPDLQRRMAERCTSTETLATDHSPFFSAPEDLARILIDAQSSG
jgi:pimeloyl-ACP methyl ester carboxylesterase